MLCGHSLLVASPPTSDLGIRQIGTAAGVSHSSPDFISGRSIRSSIERSQEAGDRNGFSILRSPKRCPCCKSSVNRSSHCAWMAAATIKESYQGRRYLPCNGELPDKALEKSGWSGVAERQCRNIALPHPPSSVCKSLQRNIEEFLNDLVADYCLLGFDCVRISCSARRDLAAAFRSNEYTNIFVSTKNLPGIHLIPAEVLSSVYMLHPPHDCIKALRVPELAVNWASHWRKAAFKVFCCARATNLARSIKSSSALKVMFFIQNIVYTKQY